MKLIIQKTTELGVNEIIPYQASRSVVKIDNKEYNYKIISIDSEYFTDTTTTYQIIKIELESKDKYKINNLTLELDFLKESQRIIDYILK